MAMILVLIALVTAARVFPESGTLAGGLVPAIPEDFDLYFVLPWLGFILAGAAGIMWFSYWVAARGYGGEGETPAEDDGRADRLKDWLRVMSTTAALGVVGGGLVIMAFLVLGAELLAPEGVVPEGIDVAEDLTLLLSEVWGPFGFWLLTIGIVIALSGTILANQDGWPRMFTDATRLLFGDKENSRLVRWLSERRRLKNLYVIVTVTILPLLVFFFVRDPVEILSIAGIVAAVHTPVVVFLTLYLNRKQLPRELQPSPVWSLAMIAAGGFFTMFAVLHFADLLG